MKLDIGTLENWLWEAASAIRGAVEANKYKDYILPLIFLKVIPQFIPPKHLYKLSSILSLKLYLNSSSFR
jgi:type I restriction-modification system DNA methylase subunit